MNDSLKGLFNEKSHLWAKSVKQSEEEKDFAHKQSLTWMSTEDPVECNKN